MQVAAHLGPAHASLRFGGDGIVFFDPFWFEVEVYAEAQVGITIWLLFGSVDIDVSLGFDVVVNGPPIHVEGHFSVCGIGIPFEFGDEEDPADRALDPGQFADKYLRGGADAQVVQASVLRGGLTAGKSAAAGSGGVAKVPDGSAENPFRLVPEFRLTFVTTAPAEALRLTSAAGSKDTTVSAPGLGVAPMYSATLDTTLTIALTSDEGQLFDVDGVLLTPRAGRGVPEGRLGARAEPEGQDRPRRRHHRRVRRPHDRHGPARQPLHRRAADRLPPDRAAADGPQAAAVRHQHREDRRARDRGARAEGRREGPDRRSAHHRRALRARGHRAGRGRRRPHDRRRAARRAQRAAVVRLARRRPRGQPGARFATR